MLLIWVGLVTNLLGTAHIIFVSIFTTASCVFVIILCYRRLHLLLPLRGGGRNPEQREATRMLSIQKC